MPSPSTDRPFPRRHRLDATAYADRTATFHITVRAFPQTAPFTGALAEGVWATLADHSDSGRVQLHAACLMPDHLHLLVSPEAIGIDRWVANFKSFTTRRAWASGWRGALWQPSFHDRLIRDREECDRVATYIRSNPVAAGLVAEAEQWPWSKLPDR